MNTALGGVSAPQTIIHFVPHTHWDREWYEPFQVFRMRLVELVDDVLDRLDREPAFRFTLDGQLATVDDYLEIRPEQEERIRRFVGEGRLAIGPWQILMDEFLVSGETIVRNLQRGWRRAHDFGQPMAVGYLPDMFGHIAQMPQILRRAGLDRAVVWRGVPASVVSNSFRWLAPDGSEVEAEYLVGGYGNAAYLLEVPGSAEAKVRGYRELMGRWYGERSLLAMYGTDHMAPPPEMVALLDAINSAQSGVEVKIETLAEYLAASRRVNGDRSGAGAEFAVEGELRSGARANMLMGVTSAHVDIKQAQARAERWLSRYAEPLTALHGRVWPDRLLDIAWGRVIDCSAHDSICGCSVDAVAAQVLVRLGEAEQIARELTARSATTVATGVSFGDWLWLNPSPSEREGLVELNVLAPLHAPAIALETAGGRLIATQEVGRNEPLLFEAADFSPADVTQFVQRRMHGRELFGKQLNAATVVESTITLELDDEPDPEWLDVEVLLSRLAADLAARPDGRWTLRVVTAARRRVRAMVEAPALGWAAARPVAANGESPAQPVRATQDTLDNGLVAIHVTADGSLTMTRGALSLRGIGRLVDGGDAGDSYNYGPPAHDTLIDTPSDIAITSIAQGPVVGELKVRRTYDWPVGLSEDRRARAARKVPTEVVMSIELRAGEPFARMALEFDNQADDHRLRFHIPLARATDHSSAEGQYGVVERGLTCEAGHGEVALPTFPAYGWVDAGGVAVLLDHVTEYELLDGTNLALTCLRSIGMISRNDNPYREDPAGPERPMPAAQLRGRRQFRFALMVHDGEWHDAGLPAAAEQYAHELVVARGRRRGERRAVTGGAGLTIAGAGVAMTALQQRGSWLELRLVSYNSRPTTATIGDGIAEAHEVDLLDRPGDRLAVENGALRLRLEPWQIRTVQLRR